MTIDWVTIAAIIIPSAATLIGSYWQVKTMRALANPKTNQQSQATIVERKRLEAFLRILNFVLPSALIVGQLFAPEPISQFSVVVIPYAFGLLFFNLTTMIFFRIMGNQQFLIEQLTRHLQKMQDTAHNNDKL